MQETNFDQERSKDQNTMLENWKIVFSFLKTEKKDCQNMEIWDWIEKNGFVPMSLGLHYKIFSLLYWPNLSQQFTIWLSCSDPWPYHVHWVSISLTTPDKIPFYLHRIHKNEILKATENTLKGCFFTCLWLKVSSVFEPLGSVFKDMHFRHATLCFFNDLFQLLSPFTFLTNTCSSYPFSLFSIRKQILQVKSFTVQEFIYLHGWWMHLYWITQRSSPSVSELL